MDQCKHRFLKALADPHSPQGRDSHLVATLWVNCTDTLVEEQMTHEERNAWALSAVDRGKKGDRLRWRGKLFCVQPVSRVGERAGARVNELVSRCMSA